MTTAGVHVAVESAQILGSGTVLLGLDEGTLRAGDRVQVIFDLKDGRGYTLCRQAIVSVR